MTIKKKYNVGDTVWIYGVVLNAQKSVKGTVIKTFTIDYEDFNDELHYLIGVPTEIEMLLEVRTWHTISQTEDGHVGAVRDAFSETDGSIKMLARTGMQFVSTDLLEEDTEEVITEENVQQPEMAAPPRRKFYKKRKS
jgi:hypothetical protein